MEINEYQKFKAVTAALDACVEALKELRSIHAQFHGGHFEACACPEWSATRAALEQAKKARG